MILKRKDRYGVRVCARCGVEMAKPPKYSWKQWTSKEYCSRSCAATKDNPASPLCACGCGRRCKPGRGTYLRYHAPGESPGGPFFYRDRWYIYGRDHKTVYWARVVMEDKIGRPLRSGEIVHHINGDSTDDHPNNLQLLASQSEHVLLHLAQGDIDTSGLNGASA